MGQRRIVVLIDNIESDYQLEMLSGVLRATRTSSVNTLIVAGGRLSDGITRNFVYDLIPEAPVDGVLVLAGSLSNLCGVERFRGWLDRFGQRPLVCIGLDIPGRPSVHVDNGSGAYATVEHLITKHGRRKFVCLVGPPHSSEAAARRAAYAKALADHGVIADPKLEFECPRFGREDGQAAVATLFGERGLRVADVDAIVCVNDDVALGALEALTRRGVNVPDQMSIVGFDDVPNARGANPPLTTVNQRVELQGYTAARELVELLERGTVASSRRLDSQAVLRSSCGCQIPYLNDSRGIDVSSARAARSLALAFLGRQSALKAEMARAAAGRLGNQSGWEDKLLGALSQDIQQESNAFRYAMEVTARRSIAVGGTVDPCNDVLTMLRLHVLGIAAGHPEARPRLEDLFQETRLTLTQVALAAYRERDQAAGNHLRNITRTCLEALATHDASALSRALSQHLPPLGVSACTLTRLQSSERRGRQLEVVARVSPDFGSAKAQPLPMSSLGLDQTLTHLAAVVLMPLDFGQSPVGLAGFAWGAHNSLIYEQLRETLSVAVQAVAP
ncbi:MAG TPA: substrate-binding domain-containing protein [Polyangiaceae bacterium]|nr:substrate-binding domain-containing protein [Polyangiaceae bacterium]